MRYIITCILISASFLDPAVVYPGDGWAVESAAIDRKNYFGLSVANGMIGILSSHVPFRNEQVLINGAYEPLVPDGISSIIRSFDFLNLDFSIDGARIDNLEQVSNFRQR